MNIKGIALAVGRIGMGWLFLWAFLDKTFGLGWSTPSERAWIRGGSPTAGYLGSRSGWFEGVFTGMADSVFVEWLFMIGLLGLGLALILGIGMRIATISGITLLLLMYLASIPFGRDSGATNPFWDSHAIEASFLLVLYVVGAAHHYGFADKWAATKVVQKYPWLA